MKRVFAIVLFALFCFCITIVFLTLSNEGNSTLLASSTIQNESVVNQATLVVNGVSIDTNIRILDECIELPLIVILRELGCVISYIDDNEIEINVLLSNKILILNINDLTLMELDSLINLLTPTPGSDLFICQRKNNDLFIICRYLVL